MNRDRLLLPSLVLLRVGLDLARYSSQPARFHDGEASYNAAVGYYAWHAGFWDQVLPLQYKAFCGGCTVTSVLSAPLFALAGDSTLAWKALALAWTALTLVVGHRALTTLAGPPAGRVFLLLLALPPVGLSDLSLMGWGNHAESALFVLLALWAWAARRPVALGLALGVGLWYCRTAAYALVLVPAWILRDRRSTLPLLAALALGAAPMVLPAARGDVGDYQLTQLLPQGVPGAWARLRALVQPDELALRAWPSDRNPALLGWGILVATVIALAARANRVLLALTLTFAALFAVSGVTVPRMGTSAPLLNLRYHAPWLLLLPTVVAASTGPALATARRPVAIIAIGTLLAVNLVGWARAFVAAPPAALTDRPVVEHLSFAPLAASRVAPDRIGSAHSDEPRVSATLRRISGIQASAQGRDAAVATLAGDPVALEGLGQTVDPASPATRAEWNSWLATRPVSEAQAIGRGIAWNVGTMLVLESARRPHHLGDPAAARARVDASVPQLRAGLPADAPCFTCAAAGFVAWAECAAPRTEVVATCLAAATTDAEVLYGAGVACVDPGAASDRCEAAAAALPEAGREAFLAGTRDPAAGIEAPASQGQRGRR